MNITTKEVEFCKVAVEYEADIEKVRDKRDEIIDRMTKSYQVPGFRKGKSTPEAIKFHLPKEVEGNLKQALTGQAYQDVLAEKDFKPFGQPQFSMVNLIDDVFKCEFTLHTIPAVELKTYKEFELPPFNPPTTTEQFQQQIFQELRETNGEQVPYNENDFIQANDQVIFDFKAFFEENEVKDLSSDSTILQVGKINIPGFDDNILGMKLGEEREFMLPIPKEFPKSELIDKILKFKVKLIGGSKQVPAALDDELAMKAKFKDFEEMEQAVSSTAITRVKQWETNYHQDQVVKRLLENHPDVKIPNWLVLPEAQFAAKSQNNDWAQMSNDQKDKYLSEAEQSVKLSLILNQVRDSEPDAQMLDEEMLKIAKESLAQFTPDPDKAIEELYKKGTLSAFLGRIKDEYVLNFIVKTCKVLEE